MGNDPWAQISKPVEARYTGRRVDSQHPYNFFWARDLEGRCLLVFEYSNTISIRDRRPRLKEIRIFEPRIDGEPGRFILELTHSEYREIFHQLCLDIIESTKECADEKSALATLLRRTWRWHGMLKGGLDERLSNEAQKGLIGELRVLELVLIPRFSASDALEFWRGPEGAPKDFSIGNISIEAKAKRGATQPYVAVTSEHQLDEQGINRLILAVTYVDEAAPEIQDALTLTEYVERITKIAMTNDAGSLGYLEGRLDEAGYSSEHDYSDKYWIIGNTRWYHVTGDFPRLADSSMPDGLRKVTYSLDLSACDDWETDIASVESVLNGENQ